MVKQMRADLGDEPIRAYQRKMAELAAARSQQASKGPGASKRPK
jgi:hypothetical protein